MMLEEVFSTSVLDGRAVGTLIIFSLIGVGGTSGVSSTVMVENMSNKFLIADVCSSPMLENRAIWAGYLIALASSSAAMVVFSAEVF